MLLHCILIVQVQAARFFQDGVLMICEVGKTIIVTAAIEYKRTSFYYSWATLVREGQSTSILDSDYSAGYQSSSLIGCSNCDTYYC